MRVALTPTAMFYALFFLEKSKKSGKQNTGKKFKIAARVEPLLTGMKATVHIRIPPCLPFPRCRPADGSLPRSLAER